MVSCKRCGRNLTDPVSVNREIGPVCWNKLGLGNPHRGGGKNDKIARGPSTRSTSTRIKSLMEVFS